MRDSEKSPALIGYMRISKADGSQVLDLQRDALLAAAVAVAEWRIYSDIASGNKAMSGHVPPVPPANRTTKGPNGAPDMPKDTTLEKNAEPQNTSEQGETANIKQNTTNKGMYRGRRMK